MFAYEHSLESATYRKSGRPATARSASQVWTWVTESLVLPSAQRNAAGTPSAVTVRMNSSCFRSGRWSLLKPKVIAGAVRARSLRPAAARYWPQNAIEVESLCNRSNATAKRCPTAITTSVSSAAAVGVEEPIQRSADAVVGEPLHLLGADAEHPGGETVDRLLLAVDRLALHEDRAQQHAQRLRMGDGTAPVGGGDVALEQVLEAHALEEVIDQG